MSVDWLSPETWTLPATLFGLWGKVASGAVTMAALLGLIWTGIKKGWAPFGWLLRRWRNHKQKPSPLAFVADDNQARISRVQAGERVGSHAVAHFHVTNVSDYDVVLLKARMVGISHEYSSVSTAAGRQNMYDSRHPVRARSMSDVMADFTIFPQVKIKKGALIRDVIFTDNYGREHRVRSVRFKALGPQ
jgi:hypothetical protein